MTSGVYKLTFSSGKTYIGKSIDIDNRWKQHADKFAKGKAAANMQAEYNKCGYPKGSIMFECHDDHIDTVEACFINRFKPQLNGTYPPDPFEGLQNEAFDSIFSKLHLSTVGHINLINKLETKVAKSENLLDEAEKIISDLSKQREKEELSTAQGRRILVQQAELDRLLEDNRELLAYKNSSWWSKIFT